MKKAPYYYSLLPIDVHLLIAQGETLAANSIERFAIRIPGIKLRSIPVPGTHGTMVQEPHVKELGWLLSQAIAESSQRMISTLQTCSLVLLSGTEPSKTDEEIPLFCISGAGANEHCFANLVSALGSTPVYEFKIRGLDGHTIPHSTVEAASRSYLKELQALFPNGPVNLLGHSFGGRVAFEMAMMLRGAGRNVSSLILLDCEPPVEDTSQDFTEYTLTDITTYCLKLIELSTGRRSFDLADLEREVPARQREILHRLLVESGFLPTQSEPGDLYGFLYTIGTALRTRYTPRSAYPGTIHLILAECGKGPKENRKDIVKRWSQWASCVVERRSPGNRITMLKPPHAKCLADIVKEINRNEMLV